MRSGWDRKALLFGFEVGPFRTVINTKELRERIQDCDDRAFSARGGNPFTGRGKAVILSVAKNLV